MQRDGVDEAEAFARLRGTARRERRPLQEVVGEVLGER
jgi:AmiR/NasT family two-component response regulator